MRRLADAARVAQFMRRIGEESRAGGRVYFTGGVTALLLGWRTSTVDVDVKLDADAELLLQAIPRLKEELDLNVELASPADFIPELPGWLERCLFIGREGRVDFYHYDPYSQALSKIERGHDLDLADVRELLARGLVERPTLRRLFENIEPLLYRYPAIDSRSFRARVLEFTDEPSQRS